MVALLFLSLPDRSNHFNNSFSNPKMSQSNKDTEKHKPYSSKRWSPSQQFGGRQLYIKDKLSKKQPKELKQEMTKNYIHRHSAVPTSSHSFPSLPQHNQVDTIDLCSSSDEDTEKEDANSIKKESRDIKSFKNLLIKHEKIPQDRSREEGRRRNDEKVEREGTKDLEVDLQNLHFYSTENTDLQDSSPTLINDAQMIDNQAEGSSSLMGDNNSVFDTLESTPALTFSRSQSSSPLLQLSQNKTQNLPTAFSPPQETESLEDVRNATGIEDPPNALNQQDIPALDLLSFFNNLLVPPQQNTQSSNGINSTTPRVFIPSLDEDILEKRVGRRRAAEKGEELIKVFLKKGERGRAKETLCHYCQELNEERKMRCRGKKEMFKRLQVCENYVCKTCCRDELQLIEFDPFDVQFNCIDCSTVPLKANDRTVKKQKAKRSKRLGFRSGRSRHQRPTAGIKTYKPGYENQIRRKTSRKSLSTLMNQVQQISNSEGESNENDSDLEFSDCGETSEQVNRNALAETFARFQFHVSGWSNPVNHRFLTEDSEDEIRRFNESESEDENASEASSSQSSTRPAQPIPSTNM